MSVGRLLTTREVAERLGVSPETVLRRWRAGELPGFRLGGTVLRFDSDEVDAWLEARHRGPGLASGTGRLGEWAGGAGTPRPVADPTKEDRHARP
jgi:excisionase family DNA binding protein